MARSVDDWVQEQVDLTVYGRVRPGSDSKMETGGHDPGGHDPGGHDPGGHDPGGGASPKKSKKTEAATEQRKMPPRRVKCSKKSDGRELHSRPTKRKREEPAQVAAQQDRKSCVDDAEVARARKKEDKTGAGGEPAEEVIMGKRKANGSPSSSPLRPKSKRQSLQRSTSKEATSSSTKICKSKRTLTKIFEYDDNDDLECMEIEMELHERFSNTRIEISTWNYPNIVWVISQDEETETEDRWTVISHFMGRNIVLEPAVPPKYKTIWTNLEDTTKAETLDIVLSHLTKQSTRTKKVLTCTVDETTGMSNAWFTVARQGDQSLVGTSGEGDAKIAEMSQETEKDSKDSCGDATKGLTAATKDATTAGETAKAKANEGLELQEDDLVYFSYVKSLHDLSISLRKYLITAYVHGMTNGRGRDLVKTLLELASVIVSGPENSGNHRVIVRSVGTSPYRTDGFPVSKCHSQSAVSGGSPPFKQPSIPDASPDTPRGRLKSRSSRPNSRASSTGSKHDDADARSESQSDACSESQGVACSHASSNRNKGIIYPDCVVYSRDKSNFPRYLLIAEIKSTFQRSAGIDRAQLYREMIGGGMHQTEVFGLLMTAVEACIVRMQLDKVQKLVKISKYREFHQMSRCL